MPNPEYAKVVVKRFDPSVYLFTWQGQSDWLLPVSEEIEEEPVFRLMPLKLEHVGPSPSAGVSLYRRVTT